LVEALQETVCVGLGCFKLGKEKEAGKDKERRKKKRRKKRRR
jgi:hypothetical protein